MKHKHVMLGLGCLGLLLGPAALGQLDDAEVAPAQVEPTGNPIGVMTDAANGLAVAVAAQPLQEQLDERQEEMLRQIIKDLVSEGFSEGDAREMLGLPPEAFDDQPEVEPSGQIVQAQPDGEALYLPLGTTQTLAVEAGATLEMPFIADGPGILTVAYHGPGQVRLEVLDAHDRPVQTQSTRSRGRSVGVNHGIVPLGQAGEYTVRLIVSNEGDLKLGAQWIPFPQIETVQAQVVPEPDPDTELTIVPNRMVVGSIDTSAPETQHLWCRFDAEEAGQLVVLASASQGDITMQSFMPGRFRNALEYHDDDLNGSVANEGMILDVEAGETYYVRVDMRSGQRCDVEVRAGLIPLPEEE